MLITEINKTVSALVHSMFVWELLNATRNYRTFPADVMFKYSSFKYMRM